MELSPLLVPRLRLAHPLVAHGLVSGGVGLLPQVIAWQPLDRQRWHELGVPWQPKAEGLGFDHHLPFRPDCSMSLGSGKMGGVAYGQQAPGCAKSPLGFGSGVETVVIPGLCFVLLQLGPRERVSVGSGHDSVIF